MSDPGLTDKLDGKMIVHCGDCGYQFEPVILPMPLAKAARVLKTAHCPKCAAPPKRIMVGPTPASFTPMQAETRRRRRQPGLLDGR
jgi:hypothetical protein